MNGKYGLNLVLTDTFFTYRISHVENCRCL
jgi:hypothetical protein